MAFELIINYLGFGMLLTSVSLLRTLVILQAPLLVSVTLLVAEHLSVSQQLMTNTAGHDKDMALHLLISMPK